jgi:hypothetical protein
MILVLTDENKVEITNKALEIKDFKVLWKYYNERQEGHDKAVAAFSILYWMYFFDSHFLQDYEDVDERYKAVQQFVYMGEEIDKIGIMEKAMGTYQELMDREQVAMYVVMKNNIDKIKDYAKHMVLGKPSRGKKADPKDTVPDTLENVVTFAEFQSVNNSLPEHEERLRKFKERLLLHMKSEVDIYGGGEKGAYE